MSEGRARKEAAVADLVKNLEDVRCMILTDFTGIDVQEMGVLRRSMSDAGVSFRVVKNTVARRAFAKLGIDEKEAAFLDLLVGPTAIAYAEDEVSPVKVIRNFSKDHDGRPLIKGGLVAGRHFDAEQVAALGELPGRDELLARVVGSLNSPLYGFVSVAANIIRGLLNVLTAMAEGGGDGEGGPGETG